MKEWLFLWCQLEVVQWTGTCVRPADPSISSGAEENQEGPAESQASSMKPSPSTPPRNTDDNIHQVLFCLKPVTIDNKTGRKHWLNHSLTDTKNFPQLLCLKVFSTSYCSLTKWLPTCESVLFRFPRYFTIAAKWWTNI